MPKVALPLPVLTPQQEQFVDEHYAMETGELTRQTFNNPELDKRSIEHKAVLARLAILGKTPEGINTGPKLTSEQEEYIRNNYQKSVPLEISRILFSAPLISIESNECKLVTKFIRKLDPSLYKDDEVVGEYEPPKSTNTVIEKVNRYAINPKHDGKPIFDRNNLSHQDKKNIDKLLSYMNMPIFVVEANKFGKKITRELFESTFILHCWDKSDLEAADTQKYIILASQTTKYQEIDTIAVKLDTRLKETLDDPTGRLNMTDAEVLNSYREKANQTLKQISTLMASLVGDRSKKMAEQRDANASMHSLIQSWKREDERRKIIKIAELERKAALKQEVERLSTMDALKSEIFGLNRDDILL